MLIRSFFNAKGDPYYVLGFENEDERTRMFEALNQSDVFLTPLGKRMEFSELVRQLEQRDTSHLAMKGASIAMPLRGQEMNRLLEGSRQGARGEGSAGQGARDDGADLSFR